MLNWLFRRRRLAVRLSDEGRGLLYAILAHQGVTGLSINTAVEILLREKAAELGIDGPSSWERAA